MMTINRAMLLAAMVAGTTGCLSSGGGNSVSDNLAGPAADAPGLDRYRATVTRTSFGIPHIEAPDFASMGYAYGYVQAEDNLCLLAEDTLTVRGMRARYLGGEGQYTIPANGAVASNVDADFFWRTAITDAALESQRSNSDPEVIEASQGYVDGFNRYVEEIRRGEHPGRHQACRDSDWLLPLTLDDMFRRYFRLAVLASSSVFVEGVANAQPPALDFIGGEEPDEGLIDTLLNTLEGPLPFPLSRELNIGSNMYAFGSETTRDGQSLLFGNPHFPWEKTERLYLAHLKVGDQAEIMGAALYGLPAVLIGFNEHFAWSHTVSTAFRFSFYELTLNPADPTQYLFDGEFVDMTSEDITVEVLEADGSVSEQTRTLYHSHYGPMLEFAVSGVPVLSWSPLKAYTLRDANAENDRLLNQFFRWNQASSFEEFVELHGSVLGVPWVNTIATGPGKPAYYGDLTVVPNVTDELAMQCPTALTPVLGALMPGLPILDGSRSDCDWGIDADAPAPGVFGPGNLPTLSRNDWVHNCNDSYWLTNPDEPLTGFASIIGDEETARTLRTRLCITHVEERLNGSDGRTGSLGFDMDNLQDVVLESSLMSERLARESVVTAYCNPVSELLSGVTQTGIAEACDALQAWDGTYNLDSRGGHIWREFWARLNLLPVASPLQWLTPFDANDPVNTPRMFNAADPVAIQAFVDAVQSIESAGIPFDARMGDLQRSGIHEGADIPVFGGESFEGAFTIASSRGSNLEEAQGYSVTYGNSYIQTVTWGDDGNPIAEGFVTYSQSTDPASPYYRDMTEAYSNKEWIRFPYTEQEIRQDPARVMVRLNEPATP